MVMDRDRRCHPFRLLLFLLLHVSRLVGQAEGYDPHGIPSYKRRIFYSKNALSFSMTKGSYDIDNSKDRKNNEMDTNNRRHQKGLRLYPKEAVLLHGGDQRFPPMCEVPCKLEGVASLKKIIKPPDADSLWQWYESIIGNFDGDPSWADIWPSASSLAVSLTDNKRIVQNKNVVELGSGLGIAGLVAATLGAKTVLFTDREPYALHCAMSTASLSGFTTRSTSETTTTPCTSDEHSGCTVSAAILDWSNEDFMMKHANSADVLLASDVLYDETSVQSLAKLVSVMIRQKNGVLFLTDPQIERVKGIRDLFLEYLRTVSGPTSITVTSLPPLITDKEIELEPTMLIKAQWNEETKETVWY